MINSPEAVFHAYIRAVESLDPEVMLPFYHLPSLFISPQAVHRLPDVHAARALLAMVVEQLRAQAYRRTEVSGFKVCSLASGLASCTGVFARFNSADQEIARLGFSYTLRQTDGSWKSVVALVHDPLVASA